MTQTTPWSGSIGAVSKRSGVHIETIRYYERIGLTPPPPRTAGGSRVYDAALLRRLSFIRRCRDVGFSLDEIRALLEMTDRRDFTCAEIHAMTLTHLGAVRERIADLQRLEGALAGMAARCDRGETPECPILDALMEAGEG
jgi:MerR family mercuric resistance operon transcriptional regulator